VAYDAVEMKSDKEREGPLIRRWLLSPAEKPSHGRVLLSHYCFQRQAVSRPRARNEESGTGLKVSPQSFNPDPRPSASCD